jgi:dihydroorotate dehydrogenase (fumarate)
MGLKLKNPLVPSASPLSRTLDCVRQLEDAGAAAITLYSLFEEQIRFSNAELTYFLERETERFAESLTYFPETATAYHYGPEEYLAHLSKVKAAVSVPVIGSLNGVSHGGWVDYARKIEEAGADALEVNLYFVPTNQKASAAKIEKLYLDVLKTVKASVTIPVAMKLSPYFSSLANMAARLDHAGADGLVLFNRFYQPVIDVENLEVVPQLVLSGPEESRLPIRWVAILFGQLKASLALSSGVHNAATVVQGILAGAHIVNVCSAVLKGGPQKITELLTGLNQWMAGHKYASVESMRGILSQKSCPDPQAFERANYMKTLSSFQEARQVPH